MSSDEDDVKVIINELLHTRIAATVKAWSPMVGNNILIYNGNAPKIN